MFDLKKILGGSRHKLNRFRAEIISYVEERAYPKIIKGKETPYINCLIRNKEIRLTPEEVVRQLFIRELIVDYGYPVEQMAVEHAVHFGRETKRADIVIFERNHPTTEYIIVEIKKPRLNEGKGQLRSYCNATGATIGVWTNGEKISYYHRKDPNYFEDISDIPTVNQKLSDILTERWTIADLVDKDKLLTEGKTLSELIVEMEDEVLANAGVDVFEEVFKLIYTKLYDEMQSGRNRKRPLQFRNYGETDNELKATIQALFDQAKEKWSGVFKRDDKIILTPSHLAICVSSLQDVKLFNSNLDVVDDAFEYLMSKSQKGEKGQYFTPRYVIDMCVKMLNPKKFETMIDPAAGSCGFPVHTIFHVWRSILAENGIEQSHLFTTEKKPPECEDYANRKVFAIDFDEKAVRVARTLNLIAGDGRTNVMHLNTLDYERWDEAMTEDWRDIYQSGWSGLKKLRADDGNRRFNFDIVMANPPFAGDIKESRIISNYELGKKSGGKYQSKVGRDILFIERNLQFLKPGGRMAIVLPQGRFNNSSDKYIREFIAERCRILAVVGLHGNVFKPHTGTKTSVLLVQKWDDELCPRREDYPIFFATMQRPSKDNSGEKILAVVDGKILHDAHGHVIVDHDLYNHGGLTQDGIAEAFIEFARRERLSFFDGSPSFDAEKYQRLMGGLECSELNLSELDLGDRIDAEYFTKNYLSIEHLLSRSNTKKLRRLASLAASAFYPAATQLYSVGDIPFVRCVDCIDYPIITAEQDARFEKIPRGFIEENDGVSTISRDDIVITKVGTPCYASILNGYDEVALTRNVLGLTSIHGIDPYYLLIFLRCRYGFEQLYREREITVQYKITLQSVKDIDVFIPSEEFQRAIRGLCFEYLAAITQAQRLYRAAESVLERELGLDRFTPSTCGTVIKSFSQSFGATGRLDAEYYQPKYEDLHKFLSAMDTARLDDIVKIFKSVEPGSEYYGTEGVPFVRVSDVTKFGISTPDIKLPPDIFSDNLYPSKDTILLSKDGTVGIAYKVEDDMTAITSGALLHLTVKDDARVLPDCLALILNSKLVQMQAERDSNGAIIQHWRLDDIKNVRVPIVEPDVQRAIADKVQQSFALRRQSHRLLDKAVRAVELAIEHDEQTAINFIKRGD